MFDLIVMACVAIIIVHWMEYIENLDSKEVSRRNKWI